LIEFRVLITSAGTTNSINVLKSLRLINDPSIRVYMGDPNPDCAGAQLGDKFVCMPYAPDPDFERKVMEICQKFQIDLVIPMIDYEFKSWSRLYKNLLSKGTRVVISNPRVIDLCGKKDRTIKYFKSIGIPCPRTWRINQIKDPKRLPFPIFIKPRCGRGSLNTFRADDIEEYLHVIRKHDDMIVQPLLSGDEVTIDTISDFEGHFLGACPRLRVEVKSGQAYRSLTLDSPKLNEFAKRIVEGLPMIGPSNIQCFLTESGPQFFEINPRFSAGNILSSKAGLNGPEVLVNMARNKLVPNLKPRPNILMLRYPEEVFVERNSIPIFFDLDGPILDVSKRYYEVYRSILEEAKKPAIPYEKYWKEKRAKIPNKNIVSYTADSDFYSIFEDHWFQRIENDNYLKLDSVWPWVTDVLSDLHQKFELYIVTGRSNPGNLKEQLDRLDLTRWFRAIISRSARQNAAKEKVSAIREHFSAVPAKAIIVGDTEADIECGKELGFITVGVQSGIRNKENLKATGCDHIIENIQSLSNILNNIEKVVIWN
jgi:carbamoyl-phosphate synthase large subunit